MVQVEIGNSVHDYKLSIREKNNLGGLLVSSSNPVIKVASQNFSGESDAAMNLIGYESQYRLSIYHDHSEGVGRLDVQNHNGVVPVIRIDQHGLIDIGGKSQGAQLSLLGDAGGDSYVQLNLAGDAKQSTNQSGGKKLFIEGYEIDKGGSTEALYPLYVAPDGKVPEFFVRSGNSQSKSQAYLEGRLTVGNVDTEFIHCQLGIGEHKSFATSINSPKSTEKLAKLLIDKYDNDREVYPLAIMGDKKKPLFIVSSDTNGHTNHSRTSKVKVYGKVSFSNNWKPFMIRRFGPWPDYSRNAEGYRLRKL